jgi:hypothetical protein
MSIVVPPSDYDGSYGSITLLGNDKYSLSNVSATDAQRVLQDLKQKFVLADRAKDQYLAQFYSDRIGRIERLKDSQPVTKDQYGRDTTGAALQSLLRSLQQELNWINDEAEEAAYVRRILSYNLPPAAVAALPTKANPNVVPDFYGGAYKRTDAPLGTYGGLSLSDYLMRIASQYKISVPAYNSAAARANTAKDDLLKATKKLRDDIQAIRDRDNAAFLNANKKAVSAVSANAAVVAAGTVPSASSLAKSSKLNKSGIQLVNSAVGASIAKALKELKDTIKAQGKKQVSSTKGSRTGSKRPLTKLKK